MTLFSVTVTVGDDGAMYEIFGFRDAHFSGTGSLSSSSLDDVREGLLGSNYLAVGKVMMMTVRGMMMEICPWIGAKKGCRRCNHVVLRILLKLSLCLVCTCQG